MFENNDEEFIKIITNVRKQLDKCKIDIHNYKLRNMWINDLHFLIFDSDLFLKIFYVLYDNLFHKQLVNSTSKYIISVYLICIQLFSDISINYIYIIKLMKTCCRDHENLSPKMIKQTITSILKKTNYNIYNDIFKIK